LLKKSDKVSLTLETRLIHHRTKYLAFIKSCEASTGNYRLTLQSDISPYALCFALFGLHLLGQFSLLDKKKQLFTENLITNLRKKRASINPQILADDKGYMQLLCFTFSALHILGNLGRDILAEYILPLLQINVNRRLQDIGALEGVGQSGNHAMFLAIILLCARNILEIDVQKQIDEWSTCHLEAMNSLGFWGLNSGMTHLQFQNGYHQYEIFEYLNIENSLMHRVPKNIALLADHEGHFAPYPGGGGCYDYDAVFLMTPLGFTADQGSSEILDKTCSTILDSQNQDGGFGESRKVRPLNRANLVAGIKHVVGAPASARIERLKYFLTLKRPKNARIHTHWSAYSRHWGESNLWDSWFRMMTVARIRIAKGMDKFTDWNFIDFPGIGYHPFFNRESP
jgi:hypothetical protein